MNDNTLENTREEAVDELVAERCTDDRVAGVKVTIIEYGVAVSGNAASPPVPNTQEPTVLCPER